MERFLTFTTDRHPSAQVLSQDEYNAREKKELPDDWSDYIWQWAENKEEAIAQHQQKLDEMNEWLELGYDEKLTY